MENNPTAMPPIGDILDVSTKTTVDNAGLLILVWLACHLPTQILGFIVGMSSSLGSREDVQAAIEAGDFSSLTPLMVLGALGFVLGTLAYAATVILGARALRGDPVPFRDLMVESARRLIPVGIASLLVGIACGFGLIMLVLPGLYLLVRLCATIGATCVDTLGPVNAVRRSWTLTRGRFWEVTAFMGVLFCIGVAIAFALIVVGAVLVGIGSIAGAPGRALAALLVNAIQFFASSWGAVCMTKFYIELSARDST